MNNRVETRHCKSLRKLAQNGTGKECVVGGRSREGRRDRVSKALFLEIGSVGDDRAVQPDMRGLPSGFRPIVVELHCCVHQNEDLRVVAILAHRAPIGEFCTPTHRVHESKLCRR